MKWHNIIYHFWLSFNCRVTVELFDVINFFCSHLFSLSRGYHWPRPSWMEIYTCYASCSITNHILHLKKWFSIICRIFDVPFPTGYNRRLDAFYFIYICMYVCVCPTHIYRHICIGISLCVCLPVCVCLNEVNTYILTYIYIYVYIYIYIYDFFVLGPKRE